MAAKEIHFRGLCTDEELRLAHELMARVYYADAPYLQTLHWLETCSSGYPGLLRDHTRAVFHNNALVGVLRVHSDTLRIGEARLRCGTLTQMAIHARVQGLGLGAGLIKHSLAYLREHGYHLSLIHEDAAFYERFGFAPALQEYALIVDALALSGSMESCWRVRAGKPGDIPAIQKIHSLAAPAVDCSMVRIRAHMTNRWEQWKAVQVMTNEQGKVLGYYVAEPVENELHVKEIGAIDEAVYQVLARQCAQRALDAYVSWIRFCLPPGHQLVYQLEHLLGSGSYRRHGGDAGMASCVNVLETLESIIPEWEHVLCGHAVRETQAELTLVIDKKPFRIRSNRGAIDVSANTGLNKLSMHQRDFVQLLTGYRPLRELIDQEPRLLSQEAKALCGLLFPKRTPYIWLLDRLAD